MAGRRIRGIPTVDRASGVGKQNHWNHLREGEDIHEAHHLDRQDAIGRSPAIPGAPIEGPVMAVSEAHARRRAGLDAASQYARTRGMYGRAVESGLMMHACQNNPVFNPRQIKPFFAAKATGPVECPSTLRNASTKAAHTYASMYGSSEMLPASADVIRSVTEDGLSWERALQLHGEGPFDPRRKEFERAELQRLESRARDGTSGVPSSLSSAQAESARRGRFTRVPGAWGAHDAFHVDAADPQEPAMTAQEEQMRKNFKKIYGSSHEELATKLGWPAAMLGPPVESGVVHEFPQEPLDDDVPVIAGGFRPNMAVRMSGATDYDSNSDTDSSASSSSSSETSDDEDQFNGPLTHLAAARGRKKKFPLTRRDSENTRLRQML